MTGQMLYVVYQAAGVIPVGYGMAHKDGEGQQHVCSLTEILAKGNEWKQQRTFCIRIACKSGKAEPGKARNGTEIGGLVRPCFDAAGYVLVAVDVIAYGLIKPWKNRCNIHSRYR